MKRYVLDTCALLEEYTMPPNAKLFITPSVIAELNRQSSNSAKYLRYRLKMASPSQKYIEKVKSAAERSGDLLKLSSTDIDILSLSLEYNAIVLTDDYSMQNVAKGLNIRYEGVVQQGIEREIRWKYRCKGCGKIFQSLPEKNICPICGSKIRRFLRKEYK